MQEVIAERNKFGVKFILIAGALFTLFGGIVVQYSWGWLALVSGLLLLGAGVYLALSPKQAIVKVENELLLCFAFRYKTIRIEDIAYVSYSKLGEWYDSDSFVEWAYKSHNDIRRLIITVQTENGLKHITLFGIVGASGVKLAIDTMVKKAKEVKEG